MCMSNWCWLQFLSTFSGRSLLLFQSENKIAKFIDEWRESHRLGSLVGLWYGKTKQQRHTHLTLIVRITLAVYSQTWTHVRSLQIDKTVVLRHRSGSFDGWIRKVIFSFRCQPIEPLHIELALVWQAPSTVRPWENRKFCRTVCDRTFRGGQNYENKRAAISTSTARGV